MVRIVHRLSLFLAKCEEKHVSQGKSLAEMLNDVQPDRAYHDYAQITINGYLVSRNLWSRIRPKDSVIVGIGYAPKGPSNESQQAGSGTSAALLIAGSIAMAIPGGQFIGAGLIIAGMATALVTQFLLTPETDEPYSGNDDPRKNVSVRNDLGTDRPVPILLGKFRFAPFHAATPHSESLGGDDYFRALFSLSCGLVTDPEIFLGDTPITHYSDYEIEFRRGWHSSEVNLKGNWSMASGLFPASPVAGDHYSITEAGTVTSQSYAIGDTITFNGLYDATLAAAWDINVFGPIKLYSNSVSVAPVGTEITSVVDWVDRRTGINIDEAIIDLLWPRGLIHISKTSQKKASLTIHFEYRFRLVGDESWTTGQFSETAAYGAEFSSSSRITFPVRGQYDVGLRRITPDQTDAQNTDDVTWVALRSVLAQEPVPIGGISYLALRIRRSAQLFGNLDNVLVLCQRVAPEWNGADWSLQPISTPAAAFRAVLQSPLWRGAVADDAIDLQRLADWADDSIARGFSYNAWLRDDRSIADVVSGIARAGRAKPIFRDGLASVAVDWEQPAARMLLNPANSSGFISSFAYAQLPHALRCHFVNKELNYQSDESLIVYAEGYSAENATDIERFDALEGVVTVAQAAKSAKAELAERWLRRERHEVVIGIGSLIVEVGDRVDVSHDAIAVGLSYGRVSEISVLEGSGYVSTVTVDTFISGDDVSLLIVVDRAGSIVSAACLKTSLNTVTITTPSADFAPVVGDVVTIGTITSNVLQCIVDSIDPTEDLGARIGLIAYAPEVYDWEENLPQWQSHALSILNQLPPPQIQSVYSGSRVLTAAAAGSILIPHIVVSWNGFDQSGVSVVAFIKPTGTTQSWSVAQVIASTATSITIGDVDEGLPYDISLIAVADNYISSAPSYVGSHQVVGRADPPEDLSGVTIAQIGGQVLIQWQPPADVDVIYGGWIEIRHTSDTDSTAWGDTTRVGSLVSGYLTYAYRPAQPGVYMVRVYDSGGRPSPDWAVLLSDQATAVSYVSVGELQEDPTFSGTKTGCEVDSGALKLSGGGFDAVPDPDSVNWDTSGGVNVTTATYDFAGSFDWGTPKRVRLTSKIIFSLVNTAVLWDDRIEPIDEWPDIDLVEGAPLTTQIWYRTTNDDPEDSPVWSEWQRVDAAEVFCRAVQARLIMETDVASYNLTLSSLSLLADEVGS